MQDICSNTCKFNKAADMRQLFFYRSDPFLPLFTLQCTYIRCTMYMRRLCTTEYIILLFRLPRIFYMQTQPVNLLGS